VTTAARERNKRGEGERLRDALLDAAGELLEENGDVDQLSVRAVTARAGVSPTALYLHFADKEELAPAVKKRAFIAFGEALREGERAHPGKPREQLLAMAHAYFRFAREHPGHYAIMFHTDARRKGTRGSADVRATARATFTQLVEAVTRSLDGKGDPFETAAVIWLAMHGRVQIQRSLPWFELPDEDRFIELLMDRAVG
jgi:AcrR family transcriptional regulator